MKMPVLLHGQTMTEAERLQPLSMSQSWKENGESTASITMRKEDTDIAVGAWIKVFSPNGMSCVMYVKTKRTDYVTGIKTYSLAHCWQMLDEMVIFGEISPATMGGSETEVSPTAAINYLLGRQTTALFQLGTCCSSDAQGWKFQNSDIRSDLQAVADTVLDCEWTFSMDTLPWTVNLAQIPTEASMEMRMNRNLSTLSISLDRSDMYTRVYPVGNKDLHISGDYIDRNTATWGIISKVITDNSIDNEGQLRAWATKMLKRNADPVVNVRISGMELSQATGESLDTLIVGQVCRVPLPEYGTTVTERITDIAWKDVMLDEVSCTMNLANERKTIQGVLNEIANSGGAGGKRGGTRSGCDLHEHEDQIKDHWTRIQRNDYYIRMEAYERIAGDNYNYSYIEQTASYIRSEVGETANGLYSRIEQEAGRIGLVVSGSGSSASIKISAIVDGINGSQAEINADRVIIGSGDGKKSVKVYVDGQISATEGIITSLTTGTTKATLINSDAIVGDSVSATENMYTPSMSIGSGTGGGSGTLYYRGAQYYRQALTLGPSNSYISEGHFLGDSSTGVNLNHYHTITATEGTGADAGKIIITLTDPLPTSDTSGHTTNFNIAATQTYISGVAAAKKSVKVQPFEASSWTQAGLPSSRTFTYKTDASGAASSTWQEDTWYLTGGTSWSGNNSTVYLRYGSTSGTAYAQLNITAPGGGNVTIDTIAKDGTTTYSSNYKTVYIPVKATASNGASDTQTVSSDITTAYNEAYKAGGQTSVFRYYGETAPSGQSYTTLGRGRYYVVRHKEDPNGSEINGAFYYCPASDYQSGYDAGYAAGKDDLTWSWSSAASTSNTEPTGNFAKTYSWSKGYSWGYFTVTVNGHSYRFRIHITS